ncbi:MAG: casein kinase 1 family protein [Gallionella sp.]|jgi:casein kinase 1
MATPLPRLKKDRVAGTFYQTAKYVRWWDGEELRCEHKLDVKKCGDCIGLKAVTAIAPRLPPPIQLPTTILPILSNHWPALIIHPSTATVIPGVKTNSVTSKYRVSHKIGQGSFGTVYLGANSESNERVAIKVEERNCKVPQLQYEYEVYTRIPPAIGVPQVYTIAKNSKVHLMVMELLGDDLETQYNKLGRVFTLAQIKYIGTQMISRVEYYHSQGTLHRDIKPDNFVYGSPHGEHAKTLYLIDLGISKRWKTSSSEHIPYREGRSPVGTQRYMSLNVHMGYEPSRRDDVESVGLVLLYFIHGRLPWQGLKNDKTKVLEKHASTPLDVLCGKAPMQFIEYISYCRTLKFESKPDYAYLRRLIERM